MTPRQWRVAFAAAFLVVTVLLLTPGDALPPMGESLVPNIDKVEHAITFAGLALLARRAFDVPPWRIFAALLVYGALIEVIQTRVPHRSGDVIDWLSDAVGTASAFARVRRPSA